MTTNEQLELGFNGMPVRILERRRETRVERAQWWFAQMRAVVANAITWPPAGEAPAEQMGFPGAGRELKA
jgi:hypothetical protein